MNEAKYRESEQRLWQSVGRRPKEHVLRLPRAGSRVRVQEVGDGPAVLFIHGGPNSGSTWAPLLEHVDGLRCLLLDRPGTGLSDSVRWHADDLNHLASGLVADVLDALDIESAHVVASSLGGYCAFRSAVASPERFDRMVQMGCPALLPDQPLPPFMRSIITVPGLRHLIATLPPNRRVGESIMRQIGHGASLDAGILPEAHGEWYEALQRYTDTMRNELALIASIGTRSGFREDLALSADYLSKVSTPTHFIWGADDTFGDEAVARWIVNAMPDASVDMRPDSGHLPWLDDPSFAARAIEAFFDSDTGAIGASAEPGGSEPRPGSPPHESGKRRAIAMNNREDV